jgi:protein tyrosine phosphatase (PTP) superfamily phosphohydrolase (DUF442 family)
MPQAVIMGEMPDALESIPNFRRVNDHLITAGQPTEHQLRAVAQAGFEVVINLAPHEDPRSLPDETALVQSLGLAYINIPIPFATPTAEQLSDFCAAMDQHAGRRLFIHCLANKRVTAFLVLYAAHCGQNPAAAIELMHDVWQPNDVWAAFIQEQMPTNLA